MRLLSLLLASFYYRASFDLWINGVFLGCVALRYGSSGGCSYLVGEGLIYFCIRHVRYYNRDLGDMNASCKASRTRFAAAGRISTGHGYGSNVRFRIGAGIIYVYEMSATKYRGANGADRCAASGVNGRFGRYEVWSRGADYLSVSAGAFGMGPGDDLLRGRMRGGGYGSHGRGEYEGQTFSGVSADRLGKVRAGVDGLSIYSGLDGAAANYMGSRDYGR